MDTLDLIRKLYDENADPAELEQGLDEESLADFRKLVGAKKAVDGLPPRKPSAASLEIIVAQAKQPPAKKSGRLALLLNPRYIQHFAAAAAVIVAVGIGYLTVGVPALNVESLDAEVAKDEARREMPASQEVTGKMSMADQVAEAEEMSEADEPGEPISNLPSRSNTETGALSESVGLAKRSAPEKERKSVEDLAAVAAPSEEVPRDMFGDSDSSRNVDRRDMPSAGGRATLASASVIDGIDSVSWGDDLDFQTFYWQVQALGERSPDEDWEEAVPLEGSFRNLDRATRDPGWLEANSEK